MRIISCLSLSGGMGKTTCSFFLGMNLSKMGYKVLLIDSDPQSNLSFYSSVAVEPDEPTLLEVLKKEVEIEDGIYETKYPNLWIIPSDDALNQAQEYLSNSGMGAVVLRKRLSRVSDLFDFCIVDSPPQRSQISLTVSGAADVLVIPAEVSSKGINSVCRTLDLVEEQIEIEAFRGEILGILPFRDRWVGRSQTKKSRESIETIKVLLEEESRLVLQGIKVLPSIIESEQFKKAMDLGMTLAELGHEDLEYPFRYISEQLSPQILAKASV
ncbi:MAG: AAA family ATPase [Pleurocapsa sp. SU_5_0]|nr:AAA family ATPase [Pleurocapsa sp. SU_5_0]NJO98876.1 AAA family ATPase [Pleurocapsa sp. CRU_1_2]